MRPLLHRDAVPVLPADPHTKAHAQHGEDERRQRRDGHIGSVYLLRHDGVVEAGALIPARIQAVGDVVPHKVTRDARVRILGVAEKVAVELALGVGCQHHAQLKRIAQDVPRPVDKDVHVDLAVALVEDQPSGRSIDGDVRANALAGRAISAAKLDVVDALLRHGIASELESRNDGVYAARRPLVGQHTELAIVLDLVGRMSVGQCQVPSLSHDRPGVVVKL